MNPNDGMVGIRDLPVDESYATNSSLQTDEIGIRTDKEVNLYIDKG